MEKTILECKCTDEWMCKWCKSFYEFAYWPSLNLKIWTKKE